MFLRYLALYAYKPQKADELELRKGEMYRVTEKCQDGWFKGTSLRTAASGVFPGNYVTPVSRSVSSALGMGRLEGTVVIQLPNELCLPIKYMYSTVSYFLCTSD